jgi:ActR/RegA family two-component response regulator
MSSIEGSEGERTAVCRVLIVENDPRDRGDYVENLKRWNYEPIIAEGYGQSLVDDAMRKARAFRCHVALVDMRLLDHDDPADASGLNLVPHLEPTASIMVTAYGTLATMRKAIEDRGALTFVGKEEGPHALKEVLDRRVRELRNWSLELDLPPGYSFTEILKRLAPASPGSEADWQLVPADEVKGLLQTLFGSVPRLTLKPLERPYVLPEDTLSARRSVVLYAQAVGTDGNQQRREILKIAPKDHVRREVDNYEKAVKPHIDKNRSARIENLPALLWDLGAIRYTDEAGEHGQLLLTWYAAHGTHGDAVAEVLRDLFGGTLKPWFELVSHPDNGELYSFYTTRFRRLAPQIERYPFRAERIPISGFGQRFANPVRWASAHQKQSTFFSRWQSYVHGDLHAGNVFVSSDRRASIIDYERSVLGYVFQDFVELEKDVHLRLLRLTAHEQLPLALRLQKLLLSSKRPEQMPSWQDPAAVEQPVVTEIRKAFDAVTALRQAAYEVARLERMDEYYWALLMELLLSVTQDYSVWQDKQAADLAHDRAALAAALVCERLERWDESPEAWLSA